jgi:hypothetical protein
MSHHRLGSALFFGVIEAQLHRVVPVSIFCLYLSNCAWTCLNYSTSHISTFIVEDASHSDFSTNNTVHDIIFFEPRTPDF